MAPPPGGPERGRGGYRRRDGERPERGDPDEHVLDRLGVEPVCDIERSVVEALLHALLGGVAEQHERERADRREREQRGDLEPEIARREPVPDEPRRLLRALRQRPPDAPPG